MFRYAYQQFHRRSRCIPWVRFGLESGRPGWDRGTPPLHMDSLNKSPWMRRMDVKPVPTEGRGSRLRGNDGLQASCSEVPWGKMKGIDDRCLWTRGQIFIPIDGVLSDTGSPAHAGSGSKRANWRTKQNRFPRPRGEWAGGLGTKLHVNAVPPRPSGNRRGEDEDALCFLLLVSSGRRITPIYGGAVPSVDGFDKGITDDFIKKGSLRTVERG